MLDSSLRFHPQARTILPESAEGYPTVVQLGTRWRVVACRDGIQWILQCRIRPDRPERVTRDDWRGRSYCRTREALLRCCRDHAGEIGPAALATLEALPARIGGGQ